jgi:hypothetical protein
VGSRKKCSTIELKNKFQNTVDDDDVPDIFMCADCQMVHSYAIITVVQLKTCSRHNPGTKCEPEQRLENDAVKLNLRKFQSTVDDDYVLDTVLCVDCNGKIVA